MSEVEELERAAEKGANLRLEPEVAVEPVPSSRATLEARIEALHEMRGAAFLDRVPFDEAALRDAESELAALDDAEGEVRRRAAKAADDEQVRQRAANTKMFLTASTDWLVRIEEAEAMARAMVSAMAAAEGHRREVQRLLSLLIGGIPIVVDVHVQEDRRSRALCALLAGLTGRNVFGDVRFQTLSAAGDPWALEERRVIAEVKEQLTGDSNG